MSEIKEKSKLNLSITLHKDNATKRLSFRPLPGSKAVTFRSNKLLRALCHELTRIPEDLFILITPKGSDYYEVVVTRALFDDVFLAGEGTQFDQIVGSLTGLTPNNCHTEVSSLVNKIAQERRAEIKHPYHDYTLEDALKLAKGSLKRDGLFTDADEPFPTLDRAFEIIHRERSFCGFNWITGSVALEVIRAANGEKVKYLA